LFGKDFEGKMISQVEDVEGIEGYMKYDNYLVV
jgi:hypothetical protein